MLFDPPDAFTLKGKHCILLDVYQFLTKFAVLENLVFSNDVHRDPDAKFNLIEEVSIILYLNNVRKEITHFNLTSFSSKLQVTNKQTYEGSPIRQAYVDSFRSMKASFPGFHYPPNERSALKKNNPQFEYKVHSYAYGKVYDDIVSAFIAGTTKEERAKALEAAYKLQTGPHV